MTRKDYVMLAAALAKPIKPLPGHEHAMSIAWEASCRNIAGELKRDNPHGFDRERFLKACGVQL